MVDPSGVVGYRELAIRPRNPHSAAIEKDLNKKNEERRRFNVKSGYLPGVKRVLQPLKSVWAGVARIVRT
jgi:hypothetical protein